VGAIGFAADLNHLHLLGQPAPLRDRAMALLLERIASDIRSNVAKFADDRETEQAGYKRYQQVPSDGLISLFCAYWNVIRFVFFG
jgi:hypothetical protein